MGQRRLEITALLKSKDGRWERISAGSLDSLVIKLREFITKEGDEFESYSGSGREVQSVVIDISGAESLEKPVEIMSDEKFKQRLEEESFHYKYLINGIRHKINENQYYFNEGSESRKNVVHSTDCMSLVQLITRGSTHYFHVFMRSSDLLNLLAVDIYGLAKEIMEACFDSFDIRLYISNLHFYTKSLKR